MCFVRQGSLRSGVSYDLWWIQIDFKIICHHIPTYVRDFRFEYIFIFNVHGSRSVRTLTRRMKQILLLEYGGLHYDLSFSNFNIVQFYVITSFCAYDQLSFGDIVDLESNRIIYMNTLTTSSWNAYWMIPTSSGSCRLMSADHPYQCPCVWDIYLFGTGVYVQYLLTTEHSILGHWYLVPFKSMNKWEGITFDACI